MKASEYFGLLCAIVTSQALTPDWQIVVGLACLCIQLFYLVRGK